LQLKQKIELNFFKKIFFLFEVFKIQKKTKQGLKKLQTLLIFRFQLFQIIFHHQNLSFLTEFENSTKQNQIFHKQMSQEVKSLEKLRKMEQERQMRGMTGTLQKCASQQLPKIQMLQNSTNIFHILK